MKLTLLFLSALLFVVTTAHGDTRTTEVGTAAMIDGKYQNTFGSRSYKLYVPKNVKKDAGLVVVIHGCFLSGEQMATGTGMNEFAEKKGFLVVYPEQSYQDNSWKCWNWFKPENQKRNEGELSIIAEMTESIVKKYSIPRGKVFLTGISAGGAMVSNLLACYSDIFAGGMVHSGLEFAAAKSESEAHQVTGNGPTQDLDTSARLAVNCSPSRKSLIPFLVVHGASDPFVNRINADRTISQFEKINAILFANSGGTPQQITRATSKIIQTDYKFNANVTDTLYGQNLVVRKVMVESMGHGWSGGNPTAPYMEPRGVNATEIFVQFFFP